MYYVCNRHLGKHFSAAMELFVFRNVTLETAKASVGHGVYNLTSTETCGQGWRR